MSRAWALWLCLALWPGAGAADIVSARFVEPTTRYGHDALGPGAEWAAMEITLTGGAARRITLPQTQVFEDNRPRLADLDGDGDVEIIAVQSDHRLGARLSVWDETGLVAASDFIGRANRWLAPIGAADLDGDGAVEIAWIDRPHLAKTLRVWRFAEGRLQPVAALPGLTNHRFGEPEIWSGLRDCGAGLEIITADAQWQHVMATRLAEEALVTRPLGAFQEAGSITAALACHALEP